MIISTDSANEDITKLLIPNCFFLLNQSFREVQQPLHGVLLLQFLLKIFFFKKQLQHIKLDNCLHSTYVNF